MQNLLKLVADAKRKPHTSDQQLLNLIREYLQVLILKAIYQSTYATSLSFMGGTCLRICYDLKRYSEDLDFALDRKVPNYSFQELNEIIARFLRNTDFEVDLNVKEEKVVQKSFIRVSRVLHLFEISARESQKIHVKLEVDTKPVPVSDDEIETFFVTKFNEIFPILKHRNETLFAGKILAALHREYTKGRDFYDLIWYLNRKTKIDFEYLNLGLKQAGLKLQLQNNQEVIQALAKRVDTIHVNDIMQDIGPFMEDLTEKRWLQDYSLVFNQASERFLE